jgi:hypothetical protein
MAKLAKALDGLYEAVEGFVQRAFDSANDRTAALEKRVGEINERAAHWQRVEALEARVAELEAKLEEKPG